MFQLIINFILSLVKLFVKFLSDIQIDIFGVNFSFYSFILASILILVFVSGFISIVSKAGSSFVSIGRDVRSRRLEEIREEKYKSRLAESRRYNEETFQRHRAQIISDYEARRKEYRRNRR